MSSVTIQSSLPKAAYTQCQQLVQLRRDWSNLSQEAKEAAKQRDCWKKRSSGQVAKMDRVRAGLKEFERTIYRAFEAISDQVITSAQKEKHISTIPSRKASKVKARNTVFLIREAFREIATEAEQAAKQSLTLSSEIQQYAEFARHLAKNWRPLR